VDVAVRVKPGSRKGPLVETNATGVTVYLQQRAVDGSANTALVATLAAHFGVSKSRVQILRGHISRTKTVRVDLD
jgi:uncharacterized protein YggU (UPF0235/DUF167 family)